MVVLVFASFKQIFNFPISLPRRFLAPSILTRTALLVHACSRSCDRTNLGFRQLLSRKKRKKRPFSKGTAT
jgi:hypothetical protein